MLGDAALLDPARRAIADARHNAARAVHDAAEDVAARYDEIDDAYLRERAADVRDVGRRVVRALLGEQAEAVQRGDMLVTDELLPGDAATLDPAQVAGVATAHGGATGHAAIIARSLGVPTVVGAGPAILAVPAGTRLLLDGDAGTIVVDPDPDTAAKHEARTTAAAERRVRAAQARDRARDHARRHANRGRGEPRRRRRRRARGRAGRRGRRPPALRVPVPGPHRAARRGRAGRGVHGRREGRSTAAR